MQRLPLQAEISSFFDFDARIGTEARFTGQIQNVRPLAWGGFLILRLPNYLLQVVVNREVLGGLIDTLRPESTVRVKGMLAAAKLKDKALHPGNVELQASSIEVVSVPSMHPLPVDTTKKELAAAMHTIFDLRPLTLRHPRERALFRIQAGIFDLFAAALTEAGFTRICSPKLVFTGAEGGANVFSLDYFGRTAYLAQSPQFYKQMMVGVFGRVFEQAPVFRAEKHNTSRHVNEYISLDLEMQLEEGFLEIIQMEAYVLRTVLSRLPAVCGNELALLDVRLPKLDDLVLLELEEIHGIVHREFGADHRGEPDLTPEEESQICRYAEGALGTEFVFVTHFPSSKRPFYAMDDPARPDLTLSFDLLFRGMEITTGGQRMHRAEDYEAKMRARGMDPAPFESYLQCFRYGMPPHGGLGFGLERFTARLCGVDNIKSCSLFPRDLDRLEP